MSPRGDPLAAASLCLATGVNQLFLVPMCKVRGSRLERALILEIVAYLA